MVRLPTLGLANRSKESELVRGRRTNVAELRDSAGAGVLFAPSPRMPATPASATASASPRE
ncbi:MAG TPA: hypothetical protein VIV11_28560 [Kofleriaceae bacterium]